MALLQSLRAASLLVLAALTALPANGVAPFGAEPAPEPDPVAEASDNDEGEATVDGDDDTPALPLETNRVIEFETDSATWLSLDVHPAGEGFVLEILGDLYTLPMGGGAAERLTEGPAYDSQPRYAPDGEQVVFISDRSGREGVWIMAADGSDPRKITEGSTRTEFASPSWSPDGTHVVVSRTDWGLRTFELWAYAIDGGKGIQLTKAKPKATTPRGQRHNALGAVYSPDGRYLYYARRNGGFSYNARFPLWQIARRDLVDGTEDLLTAAPGSAVRPALSPDGRYLVYGTRHRQETGLRVRDLETGQDRWLVYPITRDEQESRFTRDLLPGYAFAPDGLSVYFSGEGGIRRVRVDDGAVSAVPFTARVRQELAPALKFPYRLGMGPVKARLLQDPEISPDGARLAFSAFAQIYVHDFASGQTRAVTADGVRAFQPTWSPDGRSLVYVTWDDEGGHLWRSRTNGRGAKRLTTAPAYYADPVYTSDGKELVAVRASSYERRRREFDFGPPVAAELVRLPANGGAVQVVTVARGLRQPHRGPDPDRIYLYQWPGFFQAGASGVVSLRLDGTDREQIIKAEGPGIYSAEKAVPAEAIRLSPDGRYALIQHANQLHVAALLNTHLRNLDVKLKAPALPVVQVTDVGVDFSGWQGDEFFWTVGNSVYRRSVTSLAFGAEASTDEDEEGDEAVIQELDPAVATTVIDLYRPRHTPRGLLALTGATVVSMANDEPDARLENATVLIQDDRIMAVGDGAAVAIPEEATVLDVSGKTIVPGFIDTHAHYRPSRRVLDLSNASFLATLAYGVTTGIDVQPSTVDLLAYQDLVDAGMMIGPRVLSTGPGVFNNNEFKSAEHAEAVLTRYRDHYRVHNLKSYIAGSRKQRQWLAMAAAKLQLMPTTEGALDMKLNMTHVLDGFSGNEHNFPVVELHRDTVEFVARSGIAYTPTLLVSYGGPWTESYYYTRENPHDDPKLNRFTPYEHLARRTLRGPWFHEDEYVFKPLAAQAAKIIRAGGKVGVGAHGQLQGLGYHWELWSVASGGLSNWEALRAATRHGAEMIGVAQDVGSIAEGKLADLVVLDGSPLEDIRNTARIALVVKNGVVYDGETLDERWPEQNTLPAQWWQRQEPSIAAGGR